MALLAPRQIFPDNAAELIHYLGDIPADRIWIRPAPGTATEQDSLRVERETDRLCEVIDGVLVEKTYNAFESHLTVMLMCLLGEHVDQHDLGILLGASGMLKLSPTLIVMPDISFISHAQQPLMRIHEAEVVEIYPDLAIEVLNVGNTKREMQRKVCDYFAAGTRLVWLVEHRTRSVEVFSSPSEATVIGEGDLLEGGDVLPGFSRPLGAFFSSLAW